MQFLERHVCCLIIKTLELGKTAESLTVLYLELKLELQASFFSPGLLLGWRNVKPFFSESECFRDCSVLSSGFLWQL